MQCNVQKPCRKSHVLIRAQKSAVRHGREDAERQQKRSKLTMRCVQGHRQQHRQRQHFDIHSSRQTRFSLKLKLQDKCDRRARLGALEDLHGGGGGAWFWRDLSPLAGLTSSIKKSAWKTGLHYGFHFSFARMYDTRPIQRKVGPQE